MQDLRAFYAQIPEHPNKNVICLGGSGLCAPICGGLGETPPLARPTNLRECLVPYNSLEKQGITSLGDIEI